jgi:predicted nuclease of predicted toxin-antitoxin system
MARVKLDECLSERVATLFAAHGHDVATVRAQGWGGGLDAAVFPRVAAERRLWVTIDLDFADIRKYPPGSHPGILVLRTPVESRRHYEALAAKVLDQIDLDALRGALIVATPGGIRVRHRPE